METNNNRNPINNLEIIKESFTVFKGRWGSAILASLIANGISLVVTCIISIIPWLFGFTLAFIINQIGDGYSGSRFVWGHRDPSLFFWFLIFLDIILITIVSGRIFVWQNRFMLEIAKGNKPNLLDFTLLIEGLRNMSEIKQTFLTKKGLLKFVAPGLIVTVLYTAIALGYVALIAPGVILSLALAFVPFIMVEEPDLDPVGVFKKSLQQTNGYKGKLFVCMLMLAAIGFLCAIPCGIGLIWYFPFQCIVMAKFYEVHKRN